MDKNIEKFYLDWEESEEQGMSLTDKVKAYLDEYEHIEEKLVIKECGNQLMTIHLISL